MGEIMKVDIGTISFSIRHEGNTAIARISMTREDELRIIDDYLKTVLEVQEAAKPRWRFSSKENTWTDWVLEPLDENGLKS